ncbi:MAG: GYF domain-containing protein, partial [Kiritimatiellia bacterium]|nr:GYF domain-containing protein [Kiritimatiellia bacterium]
MSKILDRLKSVGENSGRCHVRVSDNMTYGPVALTTVSQWAEQGRITAESEISFDRKEWVRADAIPELGLDWIAAENGDKYGPFNLQALAQLVRRGIVTPDAKVTHRETGESLDVPQALERAGAARPLDAAAARLLDSDQAPAAPQSLVSSAATMAPELPSEQESTGCDEPQPEAAADDDAEEQNEKS